MNANTHEDSVVILTQSTQFVNFYICSTYSICRTYNYILNWHNGFESYLGSLVFKCACNVINTCYSSHNSHLYIPGMELDIAIKSIAFSVSDNIHKLTSININPNIGSWVRIILLWHIYWVCIVAECISNYKNPGELHRRNIWPGLHSL